jgi:hypothetical protein
MEQEGSACGPCLAEPKRGYGEVDDAKVDDE